MRVSEICIKSERNRKLDVSFGRRFLLSMSLFFYILPIRSSIRPQRSRHLKKNVEEDELSDVEYEPSPMDDSDADGDYVQPSHPMQSRLYGRPPYMKGLVVWWYTIPSYKLDTVYVWWYRGTIHHCLCICTGTAGDASAYIGG